jgi:hypothetical protein
MVGSLRSLRRNEPVKVRPVLPEHLEKRLSSIGFVIENTLLDAFCQAVTVTLQPHLLSNSGVDMETFIERVALLCEERGLVITKDETCSDFSRSLIIGYGLNIK